MKRRWWVFRGGSGSPCFVDVDKILSFFLSPGSTAVMLVIEGTSAIVSVVSTLQEVATAIETAAESTPGEAMERYQGATDIQIQIALATQNARSLNAIN